MIKGTRPAQWQNDYTQPRVKSINYNCNKFINYDNYNIPS